MKARLPLEPHPGLIFGLGFIAGVLTMGASQALFYLSLVLHASLSNFGVFFVFLICARMLTRLIKIWPPIYMPLRYDIYSYSLKEQEVQAYETEEDQEKQEADSAKGKYTPSGKSEWYGRLEKMERLIVQTLALRPIGWLLALSWGGRIRGKRAEAASCRKLIRQARSLMQLLMEPHRNSYFCEPGTCILSAIRERHCWEVKDAI